MNCRFCGEKLIRRLIDLGTAPPSNAYLDPEALHRPELFFPLRLFVCERCWLVQTEDYARADELFRSDYAYFSSFSKTWLDHASRYVDGVVERFGLDKRHRVIEIASNDGYLLQYFNQKAIPCFGIEPTADTARAARLRGVDTLEAFFGTPLAEKLAAEGKTADLIIGNNVLAHVPDLNDFVAGIPRILNPAGVVTMEFPHLMRLIDQCQFDTIYHEHFSYFSFTTVRALFGRHGLELFDVEELPTHGGSLRIFARHAGGSGPVSGPVGALLAKEAARGMASPSYYGDFQSRAEKIKYALLTFLIGQKEKGARVAAYGAAAKGNTLLNYCGIRGDLVDFVVDASPHKQGKYLPGSRIPIVAEARIRAQRPDYILILPWNIREEIVTQLGYVRNWGGRFVVPVPDLEIL
jgi:SAM-dependent methyltransferase